MFPRTPHITLALGALLLTAACGAPPKPLPTSPPLSPLSPQPSGGQPSGAASAYLPPPVYPTLAPTAAVPGGVPTTYPGGVPTTYPVAVPTFTTPAYPRTTAPTAAPLTKSPTPTPAHAPRCSGQPTGAEILALVREKAKSGIPAATLRVQDGPRCSGTWSFTALELAGQGSDDLEPLMVVATGRGSTLHLVAAGTDVCNAEVQTTAPAGIRVLVCGF
ncbi:hypothetical protein [Actinoplanes teichomyceticus]|uniref:Uncharacterized protein n=1 Tax=Actinoplanes teichomyceticus TaxID=1867 RepID=A0A561WR82_ACTTI|nr:hypothetical protein [Actinoplanes teichomyceticus]TWG26375.1 hypothetical protein FHX34_1011359 [Actinoplanes teichomyceticus]GIF11452.1 hypothetical protein Ate01nite_14840 [Actinoplanes teichomyceticus]